MTGPRVGLIWAEAAGGVIGAGGRLPWRLPEDQAVFKSLTMGAAVVMGRRTWDSLPDSVRPLPGRRNLVLTRQSGWTASGAQTLVDIPAVAQLDVDLAWGIGGAAVYSALLPVATAVVVTHIDLIVDGDTHAPALGTGWRHIPGAWSHQQTSAGGLTFCHRLYLRGSVDAAYWTRRLDAAISPAAAGGGRR